MQVIYTNHSFTRPSLRKGLRLASRLGQTVVVALAIVGALHLVGMSPFTSSTASAVSVVEPITSVAVDYFPSQFVNQATHIEDPIEQF